MWAKDIRRECKRAEGMTSHFGESMEFDGNRRGKGKIEKEREREEEGERKRERE